MDLIILVVLIAIVLIVFRDTKCFVYFLGIVEIFFHVMTYIANHIGIPELSRFITNYIPSSILVILDRYANGLLYDILAWLFVLSFLVLDYYLIKYFFKRK